MSGATAETLFAYADDSPARNTDPLGLIILWDCIAKAENPMSNAYRQKPTEPFKQACQYWVTCEAISLGGMITTEGPWIRDMKRDRPCKCDAFCRFTIFGLPQTVGGVNLFSPAFVTCGDSDPRWIM